MKVYEAIKKAKAEKNVDVCYVFDKEGNYFLSDYVFFMLNEYVDSLIDKYGGKDFNLEDFEDEYLYTKVKVLNAEVKKFECTDNYEICINI